MDDLLLLGPATAALWVCVCVCMLPSHVAPLLSADTVCRCSWGQELCLVGSGEALGNWSVENAKRMHWTDGDVWQVDFEVSAG